MKSYTDLEQSKKLTEILPLESADMAYYFMRDCGTLVNLSPFVLDGTEVREGGMFTYLNCWSLAALLDILKDQIIFGGNSPEGWFCCYTIKNPTKVLTIYGDSLVDACVEMIVKLKETNLL